MTHGESRSTENRSGDSRVDMTGTAGGTTHPAGNRTRNAELESARALAPCAVQEDERTPVAFRDLTYTVPSRSDKHTQIALLQSITGSFSPGQMSALMGPSGSGKTTLLDVLAGRKTIGSLQGQLLFRGRPPSQTFLRRYTGYVEQFDTLLENLTVEEMLLYTAELKRPVSETRDAKRAVIDFYIDKLALGSCRTVQIGGALSTGISGGQAKRTNIALAMVTQPRVLFLDEPTSGLDSFTANETMTAVQALTAEGVTICATIHSPTQYAFDLFDRLLILVRGETVYHGPNGEAMVAYFRSGAGSTVPAGTPCLRPEVVHNSADFVTSLVVAADREGRASEYSSAFASSDVRLEMLALVDASAQVDANEEEPRSDTRPNRPTATPLWKGLLTMLQFRTTRNYVDSRYLVGRLSEKVIYSVLVMLLFRGMGSNLNPENVFNINGLLFTWVLLPAYGAAAYIPAITLEKPLYIRERADGLYRPVTYLMAKLIDELLLTLFSSLAISAVVYFVVNLRCSFVIFWLVNLTTLGCGIVLAYVIAALSPSMDVANALLPTYVTTLLCFVGYVVRYEDIPVYLRWYAHINFMYYAWGSLMIAEYEGQTYADGQPVSVAGQPILEYYGFERYTAWEMLGYQSLFFLVMCVAAWAPLQFMKLSKR